jgi:hypothetical protein
MVGRNGLSMFRPGNTLPSFSAAYVGEIQPGSGRLASITAQRAAGEYAKSRSISLVKQKANLAPKAIKTLYALNTSLLCLLIANLFYRKIRPDSINIRALINRYAVVFGSNLCTIII